MNNILKIRIRFLMDDFTKYVSHGKCSVCNEGNTRKVLLFHFNKVKEMGFDVEKSQLGYTICINCMTNE